ncbi:hypothetical protein SAMN05720615_101167 [Stenotrophomonas indicatrix]|nr:hypothetical protein SAMN05720615_101167 [Stenotrophomonas indicatrix]
MSENEPYEVRRSNAVLMPRTMVATFSIGATTPR